MCFISLVVTFSCSSFPKYQCSLLGWAVVFLAGLLLCKQNGFDQTVFTWQPGTVAFAQEHCTHLKYCLNIYPHDGLLQLSKASYNLPSKWFSFLKFWEGFKGIMMKSHLPCWRQAPVILSFFLLLLNDILILKYWSCKTSGRVVSQLPAGIHVCFSFLSLGQVVCQGKKKQIELLQSKIMATKF